MGTVFEKKLFFILTIVFLLFQGIWLFPKLSIIITATSIVFFGYSIFALLKIKPKENKVYPVFILPLVLIIEAAIVLSAINSSTIRLLFIFIFCLFLYLVVFSLEAIRNKIEAYYVIIYNILTVANLMAVFLGYILIYHFYIQNIISASLGMILVFIFTLLFYLFSLWQNDFLNKKSYLYLCILSFIMIEFFWVVTFLPLDSLKSGFLLFLIYYSVSDLFTLILKKSFAKKRIINHLLVPAFVLFFLFLNVGFN